VDSILRNGSNIDISDKVTYGSIVINRVKSEDEELETAEPMKSSYKFLFNSEAKGVIDLVQVDYRDGVISNQTINKVNTFKKFNYKNLNSSNLETKAFYSLMRSLMVNKSDMLVSLLSGLDGKIQPNKKSFNKKLQWLLSRYRTYLTKLDNGQDAGENPLKPSDPKKLADVNETLNSGFIDETSNLKRIFKNKKFYLVYESDRVTLKFDNDTHRLLMMKVVGDTNEVEFQLHNYVLLTKDFDFPETIYMRIGNQKNYEINMRKLQVLSDDANDSYNRVQRYEKAIGEVSDQVTTQIKPSFIL
jgi:hypothetical protein